MVPKISLNEKKSVNSTTIRVNNINSYIKYEAPNSIRTDAYTLEPVPLWDLYVLVFMYKTFIWFL